MTIRPGAGRAGEHGGVGRRDGRARGRVGRGGGLGAGRGWAHHGAIGTHFIDDKVGLARDERGEEERRLGGDGRRGPPFLSRIPSLLSPQLEDGAESWPIGRGVGRDADRGVGEGRRHRSGGAVLFPTPAVAPLRGDADVPRPRAPHGPRHVARRPPAAARPGASRGAAARGAPPAAAAPGAGVQARGDWRGVERCGRRETVGEAEVERRARRRPPSCPRRPPSPSTSLILVDGTALLYRCHHAMAAAGARLTNAAGVDTAATHGFVSQLLRLLELDPPPTHVAAVFDAAGKTFRHELFPAYKGQRPTAPEEVVAAAPRVRALLRALGVADLAAPGVEADDVIGTLAVRAAGDGVRVAIVSPDKDFFQLLRPGLQLLRPPPRAASRGPALVTVAGLVPYTEAAFVAAHGVPPSAWADVRALAGDPSDNVPGVPGVGLVTALSLIQAHGSLEAVLADPSVAPRKAAREALATAEGAAAARLSRRLVTIHTELDVPPARLPWGELAFARPARGSDAENAALDALAALDMAPAAARLQRVWHAMDAASAVRGGGVAGLVPASSLPPRAPRGGAGDGAIL